MGEDQNGGTEDALRLLRQQRIILSIKKANKDLKEFDKAEAVLRGGAQGRPADANARLRLDRDLEAMKPNLGDKTYGILKHLAHFALKAKEEGISDENLPQAALEYQRSTPLNVEFTRAELRSEAQRASGEAAKNQKEIDDKELARYTPYMSKYFDLAYKVADEQSKKKDPLTEMIDNILEYRGVGLVYTGKDLVEMGFFSWSMAIPTLRTSVAFPEVDLVKLAKKKPSCSTCGAPIYIRNPNVPAKVMCLNCQMEFDYLVSSGEKGNKYQITNGKPFLRLNPR